MTFLQKLLNASRRNRSLLCVGLDPDPALMPGVPVGEFNRRIVESTCDLVCAYKPNLAFYEAMGKDGLIALQHTLESIPVDIPTIADGKRADIGNTSRMYARALFENMGVDAATVNPYLGSDALEPFLEYSEKGVFVLCRTSNPGSSDFQSLECTGPTGTAPLYMAVARKALQWNIRGNVGLVVGATHPEELQRVRAECPSLPLLIPGIGAQGGDLEDTVRYGVDSRGEMAIIVSSRQILYASRGAHFADAARQAAMRLRDRINGLLAVPGNGE
ncbi:MAG: orotidine-5'-phosphate decarboxylase [Chloroflexi bacterium]|nr:orotidine-5'-phosphate decarboxylase [Chloroflexota bacterium]